MNKIYSKVWNKTLGQLVVASEFARARGKSGGRSSNKVANGAVGHSLGVISHAFVLAASLALSLGLFVLPQVARANVLTGTPNNCGTPTDGSGTYSLVAGCLASGGTANLAVTVYGAYGVTTGNYGSVLGYTATAGTNASAFGAYAKASSQNATALGYYAQATANFATAIGSGNVDHGPNADAENAIAIGPDSDASAGLGNVAIGNKAQATAAIVTLTQNRTDGLGFPSSSGTGGASVIDHASVALGNDARATSFGTIALGSASRASGSASIALGDSANAGGILATSVGSASYASGGRSVALGTMNVASGNQSLAIGNVTTALGIGAMALGNSAYATGDRALALGSSAANGTGQDTTTNTQAVGVDSLALGTRAAALNGSAIAMGLGAIAGVAGSATITSDLAIGTAAQAIGGYSIALGNAAKASAAGAVAIGKGATSTGTNAVSVGTGNTAAGEGAVAIGDPNTATGIGAVAVGNDNTANGQGANAQGNGNNATGQGAVAIGDQNTATGKGSVALGVGSTVGGAGGVAIGSLAKSDAANAIAIGSNTVAHETNGIAIGNNATLSGSDPLTLGKLRTDGLGFPDSSANGGSSPVLFSSLALGDNASTVSGTGIALGSNSQSGALAAVALGMGANASGASSLSVGVATYATGPYAVAIGRMSVASGAQSIAMGQVATSVGINSVAIGDSAYATGDRAVALGSSSVNGSTQDTTTNTRAVGVDSLAFGTSAAAFTGSGIAAGLNAVAGVAGSTTAISDIAIGTAAQAIGGYSIAFGNTAKANALGDIAIGRNASATGNATGSATAIGVGNKATGAGAVALGDPSIANGQGAIAQGFNSIATADGTATGGAANGAVALGNTAIAAGQGSVALGNTSQASNAGSIAVGDAARVQAAATRGVALGSGAVVSTANAVALGSGSTTAAANPTASGVIDGVTYNYAGTTPGSVVSVGAAGAERQITNVAAGRVSGTSTDAINGSQLQATNTAVETVATQVDTLGTSVATDLGGGATYDPASGAVSAPSYNVYGASQGNVGDAITALQTLAPVQYSDAAGTPTPQVRGNNVALVGNAAGPVALHNVAAGTAGTDAVNVTQLDAVSATANQGWNLSANGGTAQNVAPGGTVDVSPGSSGNLSVTQTGTNLSIDTNPDLVATSVTTGNTVLNTSGVTVSGGANGPVSLGNTGLDNGNNKITNVAAGTDATDAVNFSQLQDVATTADNAVQYDDAGKTSVTLGGAGAAAPVALTNVKEGALSATSTDAVNGSQLFATNQQVATNTGDIATNTGNIATNTGDIAGLQQDALQWNPTLGAYDASHGSGTPQKIGNVANGTNPNDAVNFSQLDAVSATANQGWNLSANGGTAQNVAPGGTVDVSPGSSGNLSVTQTGTNLSIDTNPDLVATSVTTGNTVLNTSGVTVSGGANGPVSLGNTGLDNGNNKITNVAAGTDATDAVNFSQLQDVATTADNAVQYDDAGKTSVTLGGTGATAPVALTNVKEGALSATSTDAVNGSQLFATNQQVATNTGDIATNTGDIAGLQQDALQWNPTLGAYDASHGSGTPQKIGNVANGTNANDAVNFSQLDAVSATANQGWNLSANGGTAQNVAPGGTVDVSPGSSGNLSVTQTGTNLSIDTNPDLVATSVTTGNTVLNTSGVTVSGGANGPVSLGNTGLDNGNNKITNVAAGTDATDAVNFSQLQDVATTADNAVQYDDPAKTSVTLGGAGAAAPVALTNVKEGALTATSTDAVNGSQLFATNQQVATNTGDIATNTGDIAGLQQDALQWNPTLGAYDASHGSGTPQKIGNVANGTNPNDAVNFSQLDVVSATANQGWNLSANGGTAQNVAPGGTVDVSPGSSGNLSVTQTGTNLSIDTNPDLVATSVTTGNTVLNTSGVTVNGGTNGPVSLGNTGLDNGNNKITNVAAGTDATDAVNFSQLQDVATTADNAVQYDDAGKTSVTLGGAGAAAPVGLHNVANGVADNDAVNVSQLNAVGDVANQGWNLSANGGTAQNVAPGGTVDVSPGSSGNLSVTQTGTNLSIDTNPDLVATSVTTGNTVLNTSGVTVSGGANGPVSLSNTGLDNGNNKITNVAAGTDATDAVNFSQLQDVATTADNAVQYDDAGKTSVTLGGAGAAAPVALTNVKEGALSATSTDAVNGSQLFATNQQVATNTGDIATNTGDIAGLQQDALQWNPTLGAYDASHGSGAPQKISNLADGVATNDAVNLGQLNAVSAVAGQGWNIQANGDTATQVAPGSTVQFIDGQNIAITRTGSNLTVATVDTPTFQGADMSGQKVTNVANGTAGTDAVNFSQLQDVATTADNAVQYDDAGKTSVTLGGTGATAPVALTNVKDGALTATSTDAVNGSQLNATNTNVTNLGNQVATNTGDIATNTGDIAGLQQDALQWNPTLGAYDASHGSGTPQKIGNVANGTNANDAVNFSQLDAVSATANQGWNLSANGGTAQNVAPGGTVDVSPGSSGNLSVTQTGTNLSIDTNPDLVATSVTTGNTALNTSGVTVSGGANGPVSLGNTGLDNGNNKITNVAAGTDATDAVNFSQLQDVATTADNAVQYDDAGKTSVTLGGTGATAPVALTNVKEGNLAAGSTDAVNGSQLFATNQQVATNTGDISNLTTQVNQPITFTGNDNSAGPASVKLGQSLAITGVASTAGSYSGANVKTVTDAATGALSVQIADSPKFGGVTVNDAGSGKITGLAAGTDATDAVNFSQLQDVATTADNAVQYDDAGKTSVTLGGTGATAPVALTNVKEGNLAAGSTDAVNGSQLFATNEQVATNTGDIATNAGNIATNTSDIAGLQQDALQWNPTLGAYDASHGSGTPQKIGNVANGTNANDAVNFSQLDAVSAVANQGWNIQANGDTATKVAPGDTVQFTNGQNIAITRTGNNLTVATVATPSFQGADMGGQKVTGVANGTDATDAVNFSQLQDVATTADNAVQYDDAGKTSVTLGGAGATAPVALTNVKEGNLAAGSTDAVNGSQLFATNQQVATNTGDISNLTTQVNQPITFTGNDNSAGPAAVKLGQSLAITGEASTAGSYSGANVKTVTDAATGALSIQIADSPKFGSVTVNDAGSGKITGLANGTAATDAVNFSQLQDVATTADNAVQYDDAGKTSVTLGGTGATTPVALTNVKEGALTATSTDAVNGSQLNATNTNVTNLSNQVAANKTKYYSVNSTGGGNENNDGATGADAIASGKDATAAGDGSVALGLGATAGTAGSVALGAGSVTAAAVAVASGTVGGTTYAYAGGAPVGVVSVGSIGSERQIQNVAAGQVTETSTDAVNGSQLYATNQKVNQNTTDIAGNTASINNLDNRVTNIEGDITNGTLGAFVSDKSVTAAQPVSSGADASAGGFGASATGDASTVVGNQATDNGVANSTVLGQGASIDAGVSGSNVALGQGAIASTGAQTGYSAFGLTPAQSSAGEVSVGTAGGERQITHVAAGSAATDAVNVSQLEGAAANLGNSVADLFGGTTTYDPTTGMVNGGFNYAGGTYNNVQSVFDAITGGSSAPGIKYFHANSTGADSSASGLDSVAVGQSAVSSGVGSIAMGAGANASHDNSVALGAGATTSMGAQTGYTGAYMGAGSSNSVGEVSVGSAAGGRQITHVADGSAPDDAVNVRQLQAGVASAVTTANDYTNAQIANISNNGPGEFKSNGNGASGATPTAGGVNSSAGGAGASASGANSTALGNDAKATADNSTALGQGSVADRANTVSVGTTGNNRQVVNVAAGTEKTDAVNVGQLDAAQAGSVQYDRNADGSVNHESLTMNPGGAPAVVHNVGAGTADTDAVNVGQLNDGLTKSMDWSKSYTDQRFQTLDQNLNRIGNRANAGIASSMAMASLPQAYQPNQNSAGVALGTFHGETGIAVGVSTITESGRYVFKLNATSNTRGDTGVGVGAGMVW